MLRELSVTEQRYRAVHSAGEPDPARQGADSLASMAVWDELKVVLARCAISSRAP